MIELTLNKKLESTVGPLNLDISLNLKSNSFNVLFGRSGAGKTSILRMIAGLMTPDSGLIKVDNEIWFDSIHGTNRPPQKRQIGMVFQDYALFPNMTVRDNLKFALSNGQNSKIVDELIEIVELGDLQTKKPLTLSGGQKQRVALARSLVQSPKILMLDEALSALDQDMRAKLQDYLLKVHHEYKLITILVTHDVSEILKTADNMIMIENGKVESTGNPIDLFSHKEVSGKFQFTGEVLNIEKQDVIYVVTVLIGKDVVKVVAEEDEATTLLIGDKVLVASKAFNPIIRKL